MCEFEVIDPRYSLGSLGMLSSFLLESDPRPAAVQLHDRYSFGGGWCPFRGFRAVLRDGVPHLQYPGDPDLAPFAKATLRKETIYVYPHSWVMIRQENGDFEVARMD